MTIVNVALPSIRSDVHASVAGIQRTVGAYTLVIASLLMAAGSLGDRLGRLGSGAGGYLQLGSVAVTNMHRVFSCGTLRQPDVQQAPYGCVVRTTDDSLPGYRIGWLRITDPDVIATSGSDRHPILRRGTDGDSVTRSCLELDDAELAATDAYEVSDYSRHEVTLASGVAAWAYLAGQREEQDAGAASRGPGKLTLHLAKVRKLR